MHFKTKWLPKLNMVIFVLLVISGLTVALPENEFVGCYNNNPRGQLYYSQNSATTSDCIDSCKRHKYRYATISLDKTCVCINVLGSKKEDHSCAEICHNCSLKEAGLTDVYTTGIEVPGPPEELTVSNVTDTSAYITWKKPNPATNIIAYEITATVLHTYSRVNIPERMFSFSNNTFAVELNFSPGTKYKITLQAVSNEGKGFPVSETLETLIGVPDNIPSTPTVLKREGKTMLVQLHPVINNNGPITSYRIVVINDDLDQAFQEDYLKSYNEAMDEGVGYYITAEIPPQDVMKDFTVGDGRVYSGFSNSVLEPSGHYRVLLGVVSSYNNVTKSAYSASQKVVNIERLPQPEADNPGLIIGLSVAIGLMTFVFIAGIIGFIILTRRVSNRRRRLTDNQELTMQGPMIEIENTGYIPEEDVAPKNHYETLKQQLWNIPQSFIKIDPMNTLGIGKFGRVNSGTVRKENNMIPVAVYTIFDRKLGHENRRTMLKELDLLIRTGKHENVLNLIGTCETPDTLFVVLEYNSMNLKDVLLGSRDALPGRFSNMQESQALQIALGVAKGMYHLEALKIVHKQLCARNVLISDGMVPKVSGYGLAQYCNRNMVPDYTRWTAAEVFRTQQHPPRCDVWSFAVVLWEICILGGTPYASAPNNEIPERIMRGLRLTQLRYISDDLYQLMLNCWQLDLDERPSFRDLIEALQEIAGNNLSQHLNFNLYSEFQYEQFYPDMELAVRTVF